MPPGKQFNILAEAYRPASSHTYGTPAEMLERAGVSSSSQGSLLLTLPFSLDDTTAGSETELQAVVAGRKDFVDLPLIIEQSNYFANIMKRAVAGDAPKRLISDLERFLTNNSTNVWENSWVRFPRSVLSSFAAQILENDFLLDKKNPAAGRRSDVERFFCHGPAGEDFLRLPISYLIKLALADVIGSQEILPPVIRRTGERLMGHYLNDNTSPETFSFHVVPLSPVNGMGRGIARETAKRFLLTQLLVMYANAGFGLKDAGQRAMIYFSPHPPLRQKALNDHVSDAFYRELFMSPCLSGWDKGEEKFRYMQLCHQVLSRSQLNAVAKLREAGIIVNNLVVLPNVSNVSLANNGTHLSLGSRRLSRAMSDPQSGFGQAEEKHLGDLVIKITEHFLPLFVGTYSASPYRLAYTDFHPEQALGFLPHELDYTHLRMLWRRWQKKARMKFFGKAVTPFGPPWLDGLVSGVFGFKGDFVPDFRLVDYLVCLLSTDRSPALDGRLGNADRLRKDLADMGVFDEQMSVYLLYKLREFGKMGFSGFEGRHYSVFESLEKDMGCAADMQTLVTALAFKYLANDEVSHAHIPDHPSVESERRQIFFGSAIGIPTFYVSKDTTNTFLLKIVKRTAGTRLSRRYPGYLRVTVNEYRRALLTLIREDAADLVEILGLGETIRDLEARLDHPDYHSAVGRLSRGILKEAGASSPMKATAREYNEGGEQYYRETLRVRHIEEGFRFLEEDLRQADKESQVLDDSLRKAMRFVLQGEHPSPYLDRVKYDVIREQADPATLIRLINLVLLSVHIDTEQASAVLEREPIHADDESSIHRAG